jgi:hypothetical protein
MLNEFVKSNSPELITRCRARATLRFAPNKVPTAIDHGVPQFLEQLTEALGAAQQTATQPATGPTAALGSTAIGRAAALHGAELLRLGFTMDQVVHEYGDVCQAITELAVEQHASISADEFRTMNGCIDDAIADSVTAFGKARHSEMSGQTDALIDVLTGFALEEIRLIDIAKQSFVAIKSGNIGSAGATGMLLSRALEDLQSLAERSLPEIRRSAERAARVSP